MVSRLFKQPSKSSKPFKLFKLFKQSFKHICALFFLFLLFGNLIPGVLSENHLPEDQERFQTAIIYYNEACSMCSMYIKQELIPTLEELGIQKIIKKDYVNERKNRVVLNELNKKLNIPPELQGHFVVFIDNQLILGGHAPKQVITDLLTKNYASDLEIPRLLVLQDEMKDAQSYSAWGFKGDAKEYPLDTPISEYLAWFSINKDSLEEPAVAYSNSWSLGKMLPLIISSGFLDGINPCAFAVLLLFIAFLYTIKRTKANILKMGIAYILAIFTAYILIGIGLIKAFIFTGYPHLMAQISAYLMITLGVISIWSYLFPKKSINLGIPSFSKEYLKKWMYKSTIPAALVLGFLVGLCTFPCSGGIYVAVIGLLAAKTTYLHGFIYLIIYNIMFVMPLVIILITASNKKATEKITKWEQSKSKTMRLILGIVMILLGLVILFWFI